MTETFEIYIFQSYISKRRTFQVPKHENKKFMHSKRDAFPFFVVFMSHLDTNISWNIYYASIGSENLRCIRTTSDINTFATLSNRLLKRIQKQGSKHRSITSKLKKYLANISIFSIFLQTQQQTSSKLFHWFELELFIGTFAIDIAFLRCLFVFFFSICWNVCLFICLSDYRAVIAFLSSIFVSMYLHLFVFLWVGILYFELLFCFNSIFFRNSYFCV